MSRRRNFDDKRMKAEDHQKWLRYTRAKEIRRAALDPRPDYIGFALCNITKRCRDKKGDFGNHDTVRDEQARWQRSTRSAPVTLPKLAFMDGAG
jgi:hypothetical protein